MMTKLSDLGIESYCFRAIKDNSAVIDALRECGLSRIELCFVHADFSDPAAFKKIVALYRGRGVVISSIFTPSLKLPSERSEIDSNASLSTEIFSFLAILVKDLTNSSFVAFLKDI